MNSDGVLLDSGDPSQIPSNVHLVGSSLHWTKPSGMVEDKTISCYKVTARYVDTVPYSKELFNLIRTYHKVGVFCFIDQTFQWLIEKISWSLILV